MNIKFKTEYTDITPNQIEETGFILVDGLIIDSYTALVTEDAVTIYSDKTNRRYTTVSALVDACVGLYNEFRNVTAKLA